LPVTLAAGDFTASQIDRQRGREAYKRIMLTNNLGRVSPAVDIRRLSEWGYQTTEIGPLPDMPLSAAGHKKTAV
tara:strand:- start:343 stop:564 length:222 start_codon:yes stop_codon:yes gene_type:complete